MTDLPPSDSVESSRDAAEVIQNALDRMNRMRRTLVVRPEDEQQAQTMAAGLPWLTVQATEFCPAGKMYLIDEGALAYPRRPTETPCICNPVRQPGLPAHAHQPGCPLRSTETPRRAAS